eukprot:Hpha_TRINITY_DN2152_c0_g1::TRINITY_DN2152_c0_g1_i1::g.42299::m.42299
MFDDGFDWRGIVPPLCTTMLPSPDRRDWPKDRVLRAKRPEPDEWLRKSLEDAVEVLDMSSERPWKDLSDSRGREPAGTPQGSGRGARTCSAPLTSTIHRFIFVTSAAGRG